MWYNLVTGKGKEVCGTKEERIKIAREMVCRQDIAAVLKENGIEEEEFIGWLGDGELAEYICRMAKYSAMARSPEVWLILKKLVDSGDIRAIKLYHDLCDKVPSAEAIAGELPNPEVEAVRSEVFGDGE